MNNTLTLTKRSPKKPPTHRTISIRIQAETCETLDRLGEQTGRSRNEIVNLLIEYGLRNCVVQEPEAHYAQAKKSGQP